MSNGYGDFKTNSHLDQQAFDRCPPRLRFAMSYAVGPYAAEVVLRQFKKIAKSVKDNHLAETMLITAMRDSDRQDTIKDYGPSHPEARA